MTEPDWIDKMLRDALSSEGRFKEFETEYHAIVRGMERREPRVAMSAAAGLAAASTCLRICMGRPPIPDEVQRERLKELLLKLFAFLSPSEIAYLPAVLAAIILQNEGAYDEHK